MKEKRSPRTWGAKLPASWFWLPWGMGAIRYLCPPPQQGEQGRSSVKEQGHGASLFPMKPDVPSPWRPVWPTWLGFFSGAWGPSLGLCFLRTVAEDLYFLPFGVIDPCAKLGVFLSRLRDNYSIALLLQNSVRGLSTLRTHSTSESEVPLSQESPLHWWAISRHAGGVTISCSV